MNGNIALLFLGFWEKISLPMHPKEGLFNRLPVGETINGEILEINSYTDDCQTW